MLGHPVHPALVHFPVGLLLSATIADLAWVAGLTYDTHVGAVLMAGGLAAGLLAMAAGMVDVIRLDQALSARDAARGHSWPGVARLWGRFVPATETLYVTADLSSTAIAISLASAVLLGLGGWLGGRLVYTFGANVERDWALM